MKTMETTEEMFSDGMEKRVQRRKSHRSASCATEKPKTDWINDLPICCEGRKSRKTPTLVVSMKSNGKCQLGIHIL